MSSLRFQALQALSAGEEKKIEGYGAKKITAIFGTNVFSGRTIREYLSDEAYKSLMNSAKSGSRVDRRIADQVAAGMKAWAEERGVTHFTHWFQPLTGTTAEKHDSFFTIKESCFSAVVPVSGWNQCVKWVTPRSSAHAFIPAATWSAM